MTFDDWLKEHYPTRVKAFWEIDMREAWNAGRESIESELRQQQEDEESAAYFDAQERLNI